MPLKTGEMLHNRYRIVARLGEGGFGAVYRAWDLKLSGPCAIKENLDISPAGQKQFSREASLLFNLRHPNLPRVFDTFMVEGQGQYLVMDYIEGEDLQSMLDRGASPLDVERVLAWAYQVCEALIYLHSQDPPVIHRDIKPANIRITPGGQAVLVDFGIAKIYDPHLKTTLGAQAVTPGYSPPEQYGSGTTDARSDVYSLGATIYTLLTGVVPPASVDIFAGLAPPPRPADQVDPRIPGGVSAALESAMRPNRTARLQAVAAFKAALLGGAEGTDSTRFVSPPTKVVSQVEGSSVESTAAKSAPAAPSSTPPVIPVAPQQTPAPVNVESISKPLEREKRRRGVWVTVGGVVILLLALIGVGGIVLWGGNIPSFRSLAPAMPVDLSPQSVPGGHISLMHPYDPGSPEERGLIAALDAARQRYPDLEVEVQSSPGEAIFLDYPKLATQGSGPDLVLASNDRLWIWAQDGIILRLDDYLDGRLEGFFDWSLEGMQGPEGIYGLPSQAKTMALYFNRSRIDKPPVNVEELMAMVHGGASMTNVLEPYFLYGWGAAFGGDLFDDQGRCVANQTGWIDALIYLHELHIAGARFDPDIAMMEAPFINGETSMFINGSWALQAYREHLGDALGVAPMPGGPAGPARPLTNIDGYYVNPNSGNIGAAINLAIFLTGQEAAQISLDHAQSIPVRRDVDVGDPLLALFTEIAGNGFHRTQSPELAKSWGPLQEAFIATIMEGVPPQESLGHACDMLNENP